MNENLKERLAWQEERGGFKGGREREKFECGVFDWRKGLGLLLAEIFELEDLSLSPLDV